tara:strand:+ start:1241 stop:1972 length:732 start_codon:yes stop_codon:yes gene_type:complete
MEILEKLKDDQEYYEGVGKEYLSNSDIYNLLNNPSKYGVSMEDSKALVEGRYFHQSILEPTKAESTIIVDASSRNTKIYKEAISTSDQTCLLLRHEADNIKSAVDSMLGNFTFYDKIRDNSARYEVPAIKKIMGKMWKGKADIVCDDVLIDLKTTGDINQFRRSAWKYNYDSQCYIYQILFGKPLIFLVVDKATHMLGEYVPTSEFIERGEEKVAKAIQIYDRFFNEETKTESINNYYITEKL